MLNSAKCASKCGNLFSFSALRSIYVSTRVMNKTPNVAMVTLTNSNSTCSKTSILLNLSYFKVLSGSGVFDGSEILETTSTMIHLSKHNAAITFFAPNIDQLHVVNHVNGNVMPETRNVMVESARITRGNMKPLEKLHAADFHALIIPGGFGAAKNLSDYAIHGAQMTLNKNVERVIKEFVLANKPIGYESFNFYPSPR
jgi:hypothetical protein